MLHKHPTKLPHRSISSSHEVALEEDMVRNGGLRCDVILPQPRTRSPSVVHEPFTTAFHWADPHQRTGPYQPWLLKGFSLCLLATICILLTFQHHVVFSTLPPTPVVFPNTPNPKSVINPKLHMSLTFNLLQRRPSADHRVFVHFIQYSTGFSCRCFCHAW